MKLDNEQQRKLLLELVTKVPLSGTLENMKQATAQLEDLKQTILGAKLDD